MKLKTLLLVVAALAAASVVVFFLGRPASSPTGTDARVSQPLLASSVVEQADQLRIVDAGNTIELERQADGTWRVTSFHDLPADFGKLSRFVKDLTDAKIERLVTSNPEAMERLGFGSTTLSLSRAGSDPVWSAELGRNADGGGRFVRYAGENKAYRVRLTAWLDTTPRNWADSSMLALKPEQVAKVAIDFPDTGTVTLARGTAEEPFTAATDNDEVVRQSAITSLLSSLSTLRFTDAVEPQNQEAVEARAHLRRVALTTFEGETVTVALGRKPEQPAPAPSSPTESDANEGEDAAPAQTTPAAIPAGPVFAVIEGDPKHAKLANASDRLAFKVSDYIFTSLPKTREDVFQPVTTAAPPADAPNGDDGESEPASDTPPPQPEAGE